MITIQSSSARLRCVKRSIERSEDLLELIITDVRVLCGVRNFSFQSVPLRLVGGERHEDIHAWYSWTPSECSIVAEIPDSFGDSIGAFGLAVLAHEYFHLILKKNDALVVLLDECVKEYRKMFAAVVYLEKGISARKLFEELIISSFIPEGYLAEKHLNLVVMGAHEATDLSSLRRLVAARVASSAKEYVESARQIDRIYLGRILEVIDGLELKTPQST